MGNETSNLTDDSDESTIVENSADGGDDSTSVSEGMATI